VKGFGEKEKKCANRREYLFSKRSLNLAREISVNRGASNGERYRGLLPTKTRRISGRLFPKLEEHRLD